MKPLKFRTLYLKTKIRKKDPKAEGSLLPKRPKIVKPQPTSTDDEKKQSQAEA